MFFVDKYSPKTPDESIIHKDEIKKLKKMSKDDSIPHIIFYGPEGSGKKTLINMFLKMIFGDDVVNTRDTSYVVDSSGNRTKNVYIKQSNYHIIVEPNNNNFDRYLIQDVVKEYAKKPTNPFMSTKNFKVVLINNVDKLPYYAQTSLRRTMEKYSSTCRFIMWSVSLSKVIDPLRSRCYCFRIKIPSTIDLLEILLNISSKNNLNLTHDEYLSILHKSKGNMKDAIWMLQLKQFNEPITTAYDQIIDVIINNILLCDLNNLKTIRGLFYKIMINNISGTCIIRDIVCKIISDSRINFLCKIDIVEYCAIYEYNLIRGRREIIQLEALVIKIMHTISKLNTKKIEQPIQS